MPAVGMRGTIAMPGFIIGTGWNPIIPYMADGFVPKPAGFAIAGLNMDEFDAKLCGF
jgi:hypothetical protein